MSQVTHVTFHPISNDALCSKHSVWPVINFETHKFTFFCIFSSSQKQIDWTMRFYLFILDTINIKLLYSLGGFFFLLKK